MGDRWFTAYIPGSGVYLMNSEGGKLARIGKYSVYLWDRWKKCEVEIRLADLQYLTKDKNGDSVG